jgi:DNA binding domain, excisionase family
MTVEEAARLLGISRSLAYDLARRGELPGAFRFHKRVLVSKYLFNAFLTGRKVELEGKKEDRPEIRPA